MRYGERPHHIAAVQALCKGVGGGRPLTAEGIGRCGRSLGGYHME